MFCRHKWKLLSEVITRSKFEVSLEVIKVNGGELKSIRLPHQLSDASRFHIQTFTCDKCGKLKRFKEKI